MPPGPLFQFFPEDDVIRTPAPVKEVDFPGEAAVGHFRIMLMKGVIPLPPARKTRSSPWKRGLWKKFPAGAVLSKRSPAFTVSRR